MSILSSQIDEIGESGVVPKIIRLQTDNTLAEVLATGYLNGLVSQGLALAESDMALVATKASASAAYEVSWLEVSKSGSDWSLIAPNSPGEVVLPTVANRLAHFTNTTGTLSDAAGDVVNVGDLTLGASGTEGLLNLYPGTASKGTLIVKAVANTGDTSVTISNAAHGQATVISIPDGGQATAEFIISDSAGTQHITSGNLEVDAGNIIAGIDATAGYFESHPATTASGTLRLAAVDSSSDVAVTISNADHGQATVYSIPDVGEAAGSFLVNVLDNADPAADIVTFDVTVGQAALATGGTVTLQASSGTKQYKIRELYLNGNGTNFAGGGGDRLATISDGTTDYSVIPAATLQSLANTAWGATGLPFPASAALNTSTAAGDAITIAYSGGTTDYTSGEMVISGVLERVA